MGGTLCVHLGLHVDQQIPLKDELALLVLLGFFVGPVLQVKSENSLHGSLERYLHISIRG